MQDTIYLYYSSRNTIFLYIDCLLLPVQNLISVSQIQITRQKLCIFYLSRQDTFNNISETIVINLRKNCMATGITSGYDPSDQVILTMLIQYCIFVMEPNLILLVQTKYITSVEFTRSTYSVIHFVLKHF